VSRTGWIVAALLGVLVVAAYAGVVRGGPLDPPASPSPSMKTLDQVGRKHRLD